MKFQSSTLLNKDVQNFTSFYTFSCGKLCGNCGKHSKIAIFVKIQTDVLVENYLQEITSLAFSMFLFFVKNNRIVQHFVDLSLLVFSKIKFLFLFSKHQTNTYSAYHFKISPSILPHVFARHFILLFISTIFSL